MQADIIRRFHAALPQVRRWIAQFLDAHASHAFAVSSLGAALLSACFPQELLERTRVVAVNRAPFSCSQEIGVAASAPCDRRRSTESPSRISSFLQEGRASRALHFSELVHVVHWSRVGIEDCVHTVSVCFRPGMIRSH